MNIEREYWIGDLPLVQLYNPKKDIWIIRWEVIKDGKGRNALSTLVSGKPSLERIKDIIISYYNNIIDNNILKEFKWNEFEVWLSKENLFNYKSTYDLAVQTNGKNLPITFKFGTDYIPVYYTFNSIVDLEDFYLKILNHINKCLKEGWREKDLINWEDYKI